MSRKKTDEAMKEIRERGRKTAVISTVESFDLLDRPKDVDKQYSWYSSNYLALKEVDDFLDELKRQTIKLESCVRGAIVGGYGYGKTATGIYLWKRTENEGIIATPPFSWGSFQDLIDGVYGWVRYRLAMEPKLKKELDGVYSKYKEKSLNSVAKRMDVSVENLRRLDKYQINALLKWTPEEVLSFLSKVDGIITEGRFKGLVVFTDELQSTIERYPSVSRFMDDLFHLANGLKRRKGSYGIIFEMPTQTELVIADARGDVVDRLRERKLYLRCEDMFRREFPGQLWEYYGCELYDFEPWSITSRDTLDSLCQIAFRDDLGSGPRSVIEAFAAIANRWLEKGTQYSPVDLVSSYLAKEISFAKGERLIRATQEQLDSSIIAGNKEREDVIKLLAAFPEYGCPSETLERLELKGVLEELLIKEKVYGQVIQALSEGYTLTALMKLELPLEKTYERIIREFARRYSEDEENLELAFEAFAQACLQRIFKPHEKGPQPISGRWKTVHFKQDTGYVEVELSGSFSPSYPRRLVRIVVSCVEPDTSATKGDITYHIYLDSGLQATDLSTVELVNDSDVLFHLNLKHGLDAVTVPGMEMIPAERNAPLLHLSLRGHLESRLESVPRTEFGPVMEIMDRMVASAINGLFGTNNLENRTELDLSTFGSGVFSNLFEELMSRRYPSYVTLITRVGWKDSLAPYRSALRDTRLTISMRRGGEEYEGSRDDICDLFNIGSKLSLQTKLDNLMPLLEYKWSDKDSDIVRVRFEKHPLEEEILGLLRVSPKTIKDEEADIHFLEFDEVSEAVTELGYLQEETDFVIRLLEERGFIRREESRIVEVVHSIEDMIGTLQSEREEIWLLLERAQTIPDVDLSSSENEIVSVGQIEAIKSIEDFEELKRKLSSTRRDMQDALRERIETISREVGSLKSRLNSFIVEGLPDILESSFKGAVSWVSALDDCRIVLKSSYNNLLGDAKILLRDINGIVTQIEDSDPSVFLDICNDYVELEKNSKMTIGHIDGMGVEVQEYGKWGEVLSSANSVSRNAKEVLGTYNYSDFVDKLSDLFAQIEHELIERKTAALRDWELFLKKIEDINSKMTKWQRRKYDEFNKSKNSYEESLIRLGVERHVLRTRFDIYNPQASTEGLYDEVKEVLEVQLLPDLTRRINANFCRLRYFSSIGVEGLDDLLRRAEVTSESFAKIDDVDIAMISDKQKWPDWVDECRVLLDECEELEHGMKGLLQPKKLSPEEETIRSKIGEKVEADITEIIMEAIEKEGKDFDLRKFLDLILSLYQKQHIVIRLSPKR